MKYAADDVLYIVAAAIDESSVGKPLPQPSQHIFVRDKVAWYEIPEGTGIQRDTFSPKWLEQHPDFK